MEEGALKPKIIVSGDGSHTLRVEALNEHYHSHKGALQESEHVFLKMGLELMQDRDRINLLEVGFGTGLNALLTFIQKSRPAIHYIGLETRPLETGLIDQLNYPDMLSIEGASESFRSLHEAPWNEAVDISDDFRIEKRTEGVESYEGKDIDLVYYDAFAPHAQPELWVPAIWERLYTSMRTSGILVTYCAKGQVRRDMQAAGFEVERLEGPPGKREMLRAQKP